MNKLLITASNFSGSSALCLTIVLTVWADGQLLPKFGISEAFQSLEEETISGAPGSSVTQRFDDQHKFGKKRNLANRSALGFRLGCVDFDSTAVPVSRH